MTTPNLQEQWQVRLDHSEALRGGLQAEYNALEESALQYMQAGQQREAASVQVGTHPPFCNPPPPLP